jgi:hypothetical protein
MSTSTLRHCLSGIRAPFDGRRSWPHRRCWPARPDLGDRRPSRLVATAEEDRLRFRRKPAHVVCGSQRLPNNRDL